MREYQLTTDQFLEKIRDLKSSDDEWGTTYDIDRDQIRLREAVNGDVIVYLSPVICQIPSAEYIPFKAGLAALLPEPEREFRRFW